jgi:hexosaminidase
MNKMILSLLLAMPSLSLFAQKLSLPAASDLKVRYEVVRNDLEGKRVFLSAFTLVNKSSSALPASGWNIFFNFPRMINAASVTGGVQITHINGDFYQLQPKAGFKEIKPRDSVRIEFTAGAWGISISDAPAGLYLVRDDDPGRGFTIKDYTVTPTVRPEQYQRYAGDRYQPFTPALVFEQNASIKDLPAASLVKVFPTPVSYRETGGVFILDKNAGGVIANTADGLGPVSDYISRELANMISGGPGIPLRQVVLERNNFGPGAYKLSVTKDNISIAANSPQGFFYGFQSLRTLIPPSAYKSKQTSISIPTVEIIDSPRFGHRAFMLDVARNFHSKQQVMKILDLMALYKLNVFHFHFNDDEGWRIEIPGLPELTEVGAKRGHTKADGDFLHPSFGSGPDTASFGTGYYTRQDFIDILRYANERFIKVIPEIETPGHARAAIAAMQTRYDRLWRAGNRAGAEEYLLYDQQDTSRYRSVQRWYKNVINPALPSTYRFLEKVVDELSLMYREAGTALETIHFGGDEVPSGVWTGSPAVHQLMKSDSSVRNVNDAWYYYFRKVTDLMKKRGMYVYGWEEAGMRKTRLDGKPIMIANPDFASTGMQVDVWNNVIGWGAEDLPYHLANRGYKVILSPVSNMYFDLSYQKEFDEPGYYWGGYLDIDKPFKFIPYDYYRNADIDINGNPVTKSYFTNKERLTDYGKENIPGLQGLLWSETLRSPQALEYMLLPKLLALAERAWSPDPAWATEKDSAKAAESYSDAWSHFVNVLGKRELPRLDHFAGGFAYRIPTPGAVATNGRVVVNSQLPGMVVRYTVNGKDPGVTDKVYTAPVTSRGTILLRMFDTKGRGGRVVTVINR